MIWAWTDDFTCFQSQIYPDLVFLSCFQTPLFAVHTRQFSFSCSWFVAASALPPQTGPGRRDGGAPGEAAPLAADRVDDRLLSGQQPGSGRAGHRPQPGPVLPGAATSDPTAPPPLRRPGRHGRRHPVSWDAAV